MAEESSNPTSSTVGTSSSDAPVETSSSDNQHVDTPSPNKTMTEEELAAISGAGDPFDSFLDEADDASDWSVPPGPDFDFSIQS